MLLANEDQKEQQLTSGEVFFQLVLFVPHLIGGVMKFMILHVKGVAANQLVQKEQGGIAERKAVIRPKRQQFQKQQTYA